MVQQDTQRNLKISLCNRIFAIPAPNLQKASWAPIPLLLRVVQSPWRLSATRSRNATDPETDDSRPAQIYRVQSSRWRAVAEVRFQHVRLAAEADVYLVRLAGNGDDALTSTSWRVIRLGRPSRCLHVPKFEWTGAENVFILAANSLNRCVRSLDSPTAPPHFRGEFLESCCFQVILYVDSFAK